MSSGSDGPATSVLKLCAQEQLLPGLTFARRVDNLARYGGVGIELRGRRLASRVGRVRKALRGTEVAVSAICAGYFPLIDPDVGKRAKGARQLMDLLGPAGELGSTGVIVVPAFTAHAQLDREEGRKVLVELLPEIGERAVSCATRILFEPLNQEESRFLNRLDEAVEICSEVDHPGVRMMGDFFHMCREGEDDEAAFASAAPYLGHVHLASRLRFLPGQDHLRESDEPERSFVAGFRGLRKIGYQGYCSLECAPRGNRDSEIPGAFRLLERQWEEAGADS